MTPQSRTRTDYTTHTGSVYTVCVLSERVSMEVWKARGIIYSTIVGVWCWFLQCWWAWLCYQSWLQSDSKVWANVYHMLTIHSLNDATQDVTMFSFTYSSLSSFPSPFPLPSELAVWSNVHHCLCQSVQWQVLWGWAQLDVRDILCACNSLGGVQSQEAWPHR